MRIAIFFCIFLYLATDMGHAGAMLYMIQERKRRQAMAQQMAYQQYLQQQGGAPASVPGQGPAAPLSYQQQIDQRNQAIAQAITTAHSQALQNEVAFGNDPALSTPQPVVTETSAPAAPSQTQETVDLAEVWKKLDTKSAIWQAMADDQAKVLTVSEYVNRYRDEGVKINEPPEHYVQMIDQMSQQNPQMLQRPFGELLQIMAIIDYDFDNGMDKDRLAKAVLGEPGYEANKKRLEEAAQAQQQAQQQQQQQGSQ